MWMIELSYWKVLDLIGSVGHIVKIHKITPATGKERGDIWIKYYVVLQNPQERVQNPQERTM
jgi:hypothetical protein